MFTFFLRGLKLSFTAGFPSQLLSDAFRDDDANCAGGDIVDSDDVNNGWQLQFILTTRHCVILLSRR